MQARSEVVYGQGCRVVVALLLLMMMIRVCQDAACLLELLSCFVLVANLPSMTAQAR